MIFDWYNGGDWGGIPVRRLGHVMADVINAADEVYRLLNLGLGLGQSNPLLGLQFKKGILNSDKITILGTGINADPAWYDGIRVSGARAASAGVTQGDPMRYNYRAALGMFETLCEAQTEDLPQFLQDDYESALTMEYLGLGDFDEDSLTRPQQVDAWAAIREAFGKLRYYRGRVKNTLIAQRGGGYDSMAGTTKDSVNAALVPMWAGPGYATAPPTNYAVSRIYASSVFFGNRVAKLSDDDSFVVGFRGTDDLNSLPFDRPVMRGYLTFNDAFGATTAFTTDRGDLSAGWEGNFGVAVEEVEFESTVTRPFYFEDELVAGDNLVGAIVEMDATCHAVWDIDAEDYPS